MIIKKEVNKLEKGKTTESKIKQQQQKNGTNDKRRRTKKKYKKNENVQKHTLFKRLKTNKINNIVVQNDNRTMCRPNYFSIYVCLSFFSISHFFSFSSASHMCVFV